MMEEPFFVQINFPTAYGRFSESAVPMQKGGYPAVALPSIRTGPFHHSFYQPPLATWNILLAPLGKTWLAQDATSPTPRHAIMP